MPGDILAFFASLCLFLSSVEYAVPKPLPFMRLGLANLPVIFAVKRFRFCDVLVLVLLKILLSAFISGTMFSYVFLFSAAGSLASGMAVFLCCRLLGKHVSNVGLCLLGALANNAAQIAVARLVVFGRQAYVIAPLLLASGLVSGLALGFFANEFESRSRFLGGLGGAATGAAAGTDGSGADGAMAGNADCGAGFGNANPAEMLADCETVAGKTKPAGVPNHSSFAAGSAPAAPAGPADDAASAPVGGPGTGGRWGLAVSAALAIAAFLAMLALPFVQPLAPKAVLWLLLLAVDELCRKGRVRLLPSAVMIASLTALSLLTPLGKVICTVASFRITQGALEAGLSKGLTLTGMLFASQAVFSSGLPWASCWRRLGPAGQLVGKVFSYFSALSDRGLAVKGVRQDAEGNGLDAEECGPGMEECGPGVEECGPGARRRGIMAALDDRLCEVFADGAGRPCAR